MFYAEKRQVRIRRYNRNGYVPFRCYCVRYLGYRMLLDFLLPTPSVLEFGAFRLRTRNIIWRHQS